MSSVLLTRKPGDGITITVPPSSESTNVHIETLPKSGIQSRLRLSAPEEVTILKDELITGPDAKRSDR